MWLLSAHELTQPRPGDFQGDAGKCATPEQAASDDGDSDGDASVSRLTLGRDGTTVLRRELIATGLHDLCAGALTPWGTFLVNEEFPFIVDPEGRSGWVWEIDPATGEQTRATGMGRFSHEQEALWRGAWYLTDDRGNFQYLYKFVPDHRRDLAGGRLYGLRFDRATNTGEWIGPLDPARPEADMADRVGPPTAANSFSKHEGIVPDHRGRGVVFSESSSGTDPGRVWLLRDDRKGVRGEVLVEGDWDRFSRPDNLRFDHRGDLLIFEDNGSALDTDPRTGGNNQVWVLPAGRTGTDALRHFATVRGGGEGTGPWFSRDEKLLYLSIQDQAQPDGSDSRVIAIRAPRH
jgi:secreted PhoX family phosphatase